MSTPTDSERLALVGRFLWASVNTNRPTPAGRDMRDRMIDARPGDLVVEVSHTAENVPFEPNSVGTLVRVEHMPNGDRRHVVAPLHDPQHEQGWQNAMFVALPDSEDFGTGGRHVAEDDDLNHPDTLRAMREAGQRAASSAASVIGMQMCGCGEAHRFGEECPNIPANDDHRR